jgi:hypothetical protein
MRQVLSALALVIALLTIAPIPAAAQNIMCPDRPLADSTNACANTRFVLNNGGGGGGSLTVGTSPIVSGISTRVLFDNAGILGEYVISGTGNVAMTTSPVLTTPNLGTPSVATLTNATGLPVSTGISGLGTGVPAALAINVGTAGAFIVNGGALGTPSSGTLTNATGLPVSTGISGLGAGIATWLATPSSANLASAMTDKTGTGVLVFATSPALVTPALGVATGTSLALNGATLGANALAVTGTVLLNNALTYGGVTLANSVTGTGSMVLSASPTFSGTIGGTAIIPLTALATQAADTALVNASGSAASPTAVAIGSCSTVSSALTYNTTTHAFGCNNIAGSGTVNSGTSGQIAWYPGSTNVVGGNANITIAAGTLTLGVATSVIGQLALSGNTSGTVTLAPQAIAGTPTITFGTSSGTPAVTASSPLAITTATGNITCATCATITNGGALTGTAPVAISAAGAISITGVAGQVLGGSGPAFTATPTLGAAGVATGQVKFSGTSSGTVTFTVNDTAGTWTMKLPATAGLAGQYLGTDGTGILSWSTVAGSGTVSTGTAGQMAYYSASTNQVDGNTNANINAGALTLGQAASTIGQLKLANTTAGVTTITPGATAAGTLTLPAGTDTLVGKATTDIFTNKTFDTAGAGNSFLINGVAVTANTGTGAVARAAGPTFTTPTLGVAAATSLAIGGCTIGTDVLCTTGTTTLNGNLTLASTGLTFSGNISAAAWTTSGLRHKGVAATLTDTSSSGTVATAYTNVFGASTIAASSVSTFTNYFNTYFVDPVAGSNVTLTNKWALGADSAKLGTSNQLTVSTGGILNIGSTTSMQVAGNTQTFPAVAATVAALNIEDQTLTGGANVTSKSIAAGNQTTDCGARPLQWTTNTGAWTLTAPTSDGSCMLTVINNFGAGALTLAGFTAGTNTGAAYATADKASAACTITNATPGVITYTAHGMLNNNPVYLTTSGGLPTGLSINTIYYVNNKAANTFELSATPGAASINTSSAGSGTHTCHEASAYTFSIWRNDGLAGYTIFAHQ